TKNIDGNSAHYSGLMAGNYFSLVSNGDYDIGAQDGTLRLNGSSVQINGSPIIVSSNNMQLTSTSNLYLNGTNNIFFGSMSLSSILSGINARLSALENQ